MKTLHISIIAISAVGLLFTITMNTTIAYALGGPAIINSYSSLSQISASGNNVYLVWSDYDSVGKVYRTLFRASNDGNGFGHIISIGNSFNGPTFSQMASYGNNLYLALGNV